MDASRTQFEQVVVRRLNALGRRLRWYVLLDGMAVLSAALLLVVLITLAVDYVARLDRGMRATQLASLVLVLLGLAWHWLVRPLRVRASREQLSLLVERRFPQLSSVLVSAVEFARAPGHTAPPASAEHSTSMRDAVIRSASRQAADLRFDAVLGHRRVRRRAAVTAGCFCAMLLLALIARDTMGLWLRRNVLLADVAWPQRNHLTVENLTDGKLISPRDEDVTVSAVVDRGYEPPRQAFVEFQNAAGAGGREQMPAMSQPEVRFTHTFERLAQSLRCRMVGGDAVTDWFEIQVVDRPQIRNAVIEVVPPAYTRLQPYELRAGQTMAEVLMGSEVRFRIEANKPLARATLLREEGNQVASLGEAALSDGLHATHSVRPTATSTYRFLLVDPLGLTSDSERIIPVRFNLRLVADKPPSVKMRIKDVGDMITDQAVLPVEGSFDDAYGLAGAAIAGEIVREGAATQPFVEPIAGFEPGTRSFARTVDWAAARHRVAEGDRLTLACQASDFDDVSGPNLGKSTAIFLRVVGSEELLADLSRREQEHRRDFERLLRQQEDLYAGMLATSRPESEDPREFYPRLARRQRDFAGRLNLLRLQFDQVLAKLRINQLATPAVEARLGQGVIAPMDELYRVGMPRAAVILEQLPPDATGPAMKEARQAQEQVLTEMNRILASLLKWEGYQEAVTLLRDVLKMQKTLSEETENKLEEQILGPAGSAPAP